MEIEGGSWGYPKDSRHMLFSFVKEDEHEQRNVDARERALLRPVSLSKGPY